MTPEQIIELAKQSGFFIDVPYEPMRIGVFHQKIDKELKRFAELVRADTLEAEPAPVQEPYAWVVIGTGLFSIGPERPFDDDVWQPLYTAPQAQHPSPTQRTCNHGCNGCDDCTDFDKCDV